MEIRSVKDGPVVLLHCCFLSQIKAQRFLWGHGPDFPANRKRTCPSPTHAFNSDDASSSIFKEPFDLCHTLRLHEKFEDQGNLKGINFTFQLMPVRPITANGGYGSIA
jgi:hypothetical protein